MIIMPPSNNRSSPILQIAVAVSFPTGTAIAFGSLMAFLPNVSLVVAILVSLLFGMLVSFLIGRRVADVEYKNQLEAERDLRAVREEENLRKIEEMREIKEAKPAWGDHRKNKTEEESR